MIQNDLPKTELHVLSKFVITEIYTRRQFASNSLIIIATGDFIADPMRLRQSYKVS